MPNGEATWPRCSAPGCERTVRSSGASYCDTHYCRLRRGDPAALRPINFKCENCGADVCRPGMRWCSDRCGRINGRATPAHLRRGLSAWPVLVRADIQEWRVVPGFPDYEISNDGFLRRVSAGSNSKPGKLIRPNIGTVGYPMYGLSAPNGKRWCTTAHRIVALAFLPPQPEGLNFILHGNDNKLDARVINLRWGDSRSNANDAIRNGRLALGDRHPCTIQPWTRPRGDGQAGAKLSDDDVREFELARVTEELLRKNSMSTLR